MAKMGTQIRRDRSLRRCRRGRRLSHKAGRKTGTRVAGSGVVVVGIKRLQEVHREVLEVLQDVLVPGNKRGDEKDQEQDKHGEVEDGEANDTSLAQLGLLQRINGRADLTADCTLALCLLCTKRVWWLGSTYLGRSQNNMTEWNLSM